MRRWLKDLNNHNIAAGMASGLLAITGPPVLILQAANNGNFTAEQTFQWIFAVYVVGGLFSIIMPLYYGIPIVGAHTLVGVAFLVTVTDQFTYQELLGAYLFSGLLMLVIGLTGAFAKILQYVPKEIIAAMFVDMITKYMVNFVGSFSQLPLIASISLLTYFLLTKLNRWVPPMVGSIGISFIVLFLTQPLPEQIAATFVLPAIQSPQLNWLSFFAVSVPLALLILSNDAAVGLGALEQQEYNPPINRIITYSGLFSVLASFLGGQSANIAGIMSTICSDDQAGPKEKRYMGAVVSGVIIIFFGIFSWKTVPFIQSLPAPFISVLVGLALLGVFANNLYLGFSNPTMKLSVAVAFVIALANITILNISAPVWSLLIGTLITKYFE